MTDLTTRTPTDVDDAALAQSGLRRIAAISASLVGTYALTSVLGLVFWLLAARQFSVGAVGVAGAAVSLMMLLGTLGTLGLGTLLIARLPLTEQGARRALTRTSLAVAGTGGLVLAVVVPLLAIEVFDVPGLRSIAGSPATAALFAVGTGLTAVALVVDQAVLVLGNGSLQTERNAVASVVKLVALGGLAAAGQDGGMTIFLAWTVGMLASLPLVAWRTRGGRPLARPARLVEFPMLKGLGGQALSHHALNTTLQAPLQLLPMLVLIGLSSQSNGIFTTALQVTGAVFTLPFAISIALFAAAAGQERQVIDRMRVTLPLSLGLSTLANLLLFPLAPYLLTLFGSQYSAQGVEVVRILALAGLAFVVKDHYVALRRVQGRTGPATRVLLVTTVAEVAAAAVGLQVAGVVGLCAFWVAVLGGEAVVLALPLLTASRRLRTEVRDSPARAVEDAEPRRSWSIGAGSTVVLMSVGLLILTRGVASARATGGSNTAQALYVGGLLLIFAPAALGVLLPRVRNVTRVVLVLAMALLLQLSRLILYPTRFMFHDELIHANELRQIHETGRLFVENPLLPVTSSYPGLEVATDAVGDLTGLGAHASAVVVLLAARLVLALAVLLVTWQLTSSTRIAAGAVVVYACNPQWLFFNSQFSYQTLALPLAGLAIYLVLTRRPGRYGLVAPVLAVWAVCATHHLTAVLLVLTFVVWCLIEVVLRRGRPVPARSLATVAIAGAVGVGATLLIPGNTLLGYLGEIVTSSEQAIGQALGGRSRALFQNSAGVANATWERDVIVASLVLTLLALLPALWRARRLLPGRNALVVALLLASFGYPLIPLSHLTASTAEVGDRAAGFVFLGLAFVVSWWIWQRPMTWWRASLLTVAACVVFLGSVVLGSGSIANQLPGPFRVSDDARSVDTDNLAAARWLRTHATRGNVVYADRAGGLLAAAYGGQDTLTHIATGIDASRLLLDPTYGPDDLALIRRAHVRYLIADRRDAFGLPNLGVYIENGEFQGATRRGPVPEAALRKFSSVPGVRVVYDNGSVVIYDLEALDDPH